MLDLAFLTTLLTDEPDKPKQFPEIENGIEQVVESDAGYEGIIALIDERPPSDLPVIVLEHCSSGEYGFNPGGLCHGSQVVWVMEMVGARESRRLVQDKMKGLMERIIALLSKNKKQKPLEGWDRSRIPYMVTNAGNNYTGYQFTLYYDENIDLSVNRLTVE